MSQIGLIGLAVMGQNLSLNIASKGFSISVYNRSYHRTEETVQRAEKEGEGKFKLSGYKTMEEFVKSIKKPRSVIILVKAGKPVDMTIESLLKYLEPEDLIIDGGNEWFENTERRIKLVGEKGVLYMGMGVSGGEKGARFGPSMMPGGSEEGWKRNAEILEKVSAQVDNTPCVTYIGRGGSGNYVKMVHNGIEYGDMQLICEAYDLMKNVCGFSNEKIGDIFTKWNEEELSSYLIEITSKIFKRKDDVAGKGDMVDVVLDSSGSKGTGMWTVQSSASLMGCVPTIYAALDARYISSFKEERVNASKKLLGPEKKPSVGDPEKFVADLKNALYASKICSYAQGLSLLKIASKEYDWGLRIGEISKIWRGGCIIRAVFLDRITEAFQRNPGLPNLLMDDEFSKEVMERQESWRHVICTSVMNGIACPAFSGSLGYYDSYRRERLPANLIQAMRDFFGSHTFKRTDNGETVHVEWEE